MKAIKSIWTKLKKLWAIEEYEPEPLDKNDPIVQKKIEIARLFQLDDYEVVNSALHHYRFYFSDGSDYLIGIVGVVGIMDELKEHGLFPYVNKENKVAEIINLADFKAGKALLGN